MTQRNGKTIFKILLITFVVSAIGGYSLYQAQNLIKGPQIFLSEPLSGSTLASPLVKIQGVAKNISFISLNDRQIFVDKDGAFSEELLLSPGYNLWEIQAKDKFGKIVSKKIELVLNKNL